MPCVSFVVKLDAPVIEGVGTQSPGCLEFNWSLSYTQKWIKKLLNIEIKRKPVNSKIYNTQQVMYLCTNSTNFSTLLWLFLYTLTLNTHKTFYPSGLVSCSVMNKNHKHGC